MDSPSRRVKARLIFDRFDRNGDGGLDRSELASLICAVNPALHLAGDQISFVVDEIFRSFSDFVSDLSTGLTLDGLLQTYADCAEYLDRDFAALFLSDEDPNLTSNSDRHSKIALAWLSSPNHGVTRGSTWKVIEKLQISIRDKIRACAKRNRLQDPAFSETFSDLWHSGDFFMDLERKGLGFVFDEKSSEYLDLLEELKEIGAEVDRLPMAEEAFDGHLAIGRTLLEHRLLAQALESFRRALELRPTDARPHFRIGITLLSLGRVNEGSDDLLAALEIAKSDSRQWSALFPQIHVNLGMAMENQGLVINASKHYRQALILSPSHYRAHKLLGSSLLGIGEYEAAEKALYEAVALKPGYADAHCDLGCVFHAMKEEEKAIIAFQRAIDLKPDHLDALYNLGSLFLNAGRHKRASEMFGRVVAISPGHWKAHLNRFVSLFGAGELEDAKKALSEAVKMTNRIELYETFQHLKKKSRKKKKLPPKWVVVDPSKFVGTTNRKCLSDALWTREIQKSTKFERCNAALLRKELEEYRFPGSFPSSYRWVRKAEAEVILRKLLHFLQPEAFRDAIKVVDEKIWSALGIASSGNIDLSMFFAVIAPICGGSPESRKRAAYEALSFQALKNEEEQCGFSCVDAYLYIRNLRMVYFPSQEFTNLMEIRGEGDGMGISFHKFVSLFDDIDHGFGIMSTLLKLERGDRMRSSLRSCGVCGYRSSNIMFKEKKAKFCLCASCYCECRVPYAFEQEDAYVFKEVPFL